MSVPVTGLYRPFVAKAKTCDSIPVGTRGERRWLQGLVRTVGQIEEGMGAQPLSHQVP